MKRLKMFLMRTTPLELLCTAIWDVVAIAIVIFAAIGVHATCAHGQSMAFWVVPPRPVAVAVAVPVQPLPPGSYVLYPPRRPVVDCVFGYRAYLVTPPPQQPPVQPQQQGGGQQ